MSWKHLGETFDIHGGGIDLVFPHHENEIAQSRCAFHTPVMANYWMHNGFLQVEGEKMAKSLGQFRHDPGAAAREMDGRWKWPVLFGFAMLRTHYRQPIDWTLRAPSKMPTATVSGDWVDFEPAGSLSILHDAASCWAPLLERLCDDLNTLQAITDASKALYEKRSEGRFAANAASQAVRLLIDLHVGTANRRPHCRCVRR